MRIYEYEAKELLSKAGIAIHDPARLMEQPKPERLRPDLVVRWF